MDDDTRARATRLLGADRLNAYDDGLAPVLAHAFASPVASVLTAERADAYLTLLYGMLLLRRAHELEPLHEDLYRHVLRAETAGSGDYSPELFAQDLEQLLRWGALERSAETLRIRGYRDNRRDRFRYRLGEDAVALMEWLEARLTARLEGRLRDSRDRMTDVIGQLRELIRLLDEWRGGQQDPDEARRAVYLLGAFDDAVHEISAELIDFRAGMLAFAARPYDVGALKQVLGWLERYVSVYLARIAELRTEIGARIATLSQPRYRRALAECKIALQADLALVPRELRGSAPLRSTDEILDAEAPFFGESGPLVQLCERIDESARSVLRKMHRHLRDIERRSARLLDLRARMAELALMPQGENPRLAGFIRELVGSAHLRVDRRPHHADQRLEPPLPRSHKASPPGKTSRPLRAKTLGADDARALRSKREADLAVWLESRLLKGRERVLLSQAALDEPEAPRRWLDTARAAHLAGSRGLARMGLGLSLRDGRVTLGAAEVGLDAPEGELRRVDRKA